MSISIESKKEKSKKPKSVFSKQILQTLSAQQRQFATKQFRKVYAQQMSKLSAQIYRKKRVQQKQELMGASQSRNHDEQYDKVMKRIAKSDRHRQQNLKKRAQLYKMNDQRWKYKIEEIHKNIKSKNKVAMQKAQQYRQQSEQFWKNKQLKLISSSIQSLKPLANSSVNYPNRHLQTEQSKSKFYNQQLPQIKPKNTHQRDYSRTEHTPVKYKDIDQQIRQHKQKAANLQILKQQQAIASALKKLNRIEKTRKAKKLQSKVSQPTIARKVEKSMKNIPSQSYKTPMQKNQDQNASKELISFNYYASAQKVPIQQDIQRHHIAKQRKQHVQFVHRGQALEKSLKRNKKTKIMKMVKQKVFSMKMDAKMKNQVD